MGIPMWVVYDHPRDYPDAYVARFFVASGEPTTQTIVTTDLDHLRDTLALKGLVCLQRQRDDDPVIMETWI